MGATERAGFYPAGHVYYNSRAIVNACRPYEWREDFPAVSVTSPELEARLFEKYGERLYE